MKKSASQLAQKVLTKVGFDAAFLSLLSNQNEPDRNYSSNTPLPNTPHSAPSPTIPKPVPKGYYLDQTGRAQRVPKEDPELDAALAGYTNPQTPLQPK